MKANEIDIQLLLNLWYDVPPGYDINSIDFSTGNIRLNISYDYYGEKERTEREQAESIAKQSSAEIQDWIKRLDDYNSKVEEGIIIPNKKIGWERQLLACYDENIAKQIELELQPKKRGRPRKNAVATVNK